MDIVTEAWSWTVDWNNETLTEALKHATIAETWTRIRNNRLKAPNGQLRHRFHQPDLDICWGASTGPSLHIKP